MRSPTTEVTPGGEATVAAALRRQVVATPGDPAVTFYDETTGERVELSYVTYANWVAKTGSLLQDELGLGRGEVVAVDLPTHWLAPVWLGAAWSLGLTVTTAAWAAHADLVVCGPLSVEGHAERGRPVVACSLLPMGARFASPLPAGVTDFGEVVWSQPDSLLVLDPPAPGDLGWQDDEGDLDQAALVSLVPPAAAPATRLLTGTPPASRAGLPALIGPLLSGRGTVWVAGTASPERLAQLAATEHAELLPQDQPATPGPTSSEPT